MADTVLVDLAWSYGVEVDGRTVYFGPGRVPVPRDVAERKGWKTAADTIDMTEHTDYPTAEVTAKAGVGHLTDALLEAGFIFATHIVQAEITELTAVSGIGPKTAVKLIEAAKELL